MNSYDDTSTAARTDARPTCSLGQRFVRGAAIALTTVGLVAGSAGASQAISFDAGVATSSIYLTRAETRSLAKSGGPDWAAAAGAAVCTALGVAGAPGAACAVAIGYHSVAFKRATDNAAATNGCLRIRILGTPSHWLATPMKPVPLGYYSDHTRRCQG